MDFNQIEQILAIARKRSISEAAQELHVTQPSLSHMLAKAEREFGVRFFDRSRHPLTLTFAGEQYVKTALRMQKLEHNLRKICQDAAQEKAGVLKIGIPSLRLAELAPAVLPEFQQLYPHVKIQCSSRPAADMTEDLRKGLFDFLIFAPIDSSPDLHFEPLYQEELRLTAAEGFLGGEDFLPGRPDVFNIRRLSRHRLLLPHPRSGLGVTLSRLMVQTGIVPQNSAVFPGNSVLYSLAAAGQGVAILPEDALTLSKSPGAVRSFSLSPRGIGWTICAVFARGTHISLPEHAFIDLVRRHFAHPDRELDLIPGVTVP